MGTMSLNPFYLRAFLLRISRRLVASVRIGSEDIGKVVLQRRTRLSSLVSPLVREIPIGDRYEFRKGNEMCRTEERVEKKKKTPFHPEKICVGPIPLIMVQLIQKRKRRENESRDPTQLLMEPHVDTIGPCLRRIPKMTHRNAFLLEEHNPRRIISLLDLWERQ
mmetsp:Transcript_34864/g.98370  ORF Transcript_34864/g.98370 Transcript_34864/m.98370 type:complete len:164 (-) Transcript_34864:183-674(-)